jgi:hypothetical protein
MAVFVHNRILLDRGVLDTEKCQCGAFKCVVHCPECGSAACYAAKRKNTQIYLADSPKPFPNRGFSCRQCGTTFTELESLTSCRVRSIGELKVQAEVEQTINNKGSQELLEDYLALHPERRPKERSPLDVADEERERRKRGEDAV